MANNYGKMALHDDFIKIKSSFAKRDYLFKFFDLLYDFGTALIFSALSSHFIIFLLLSLIPVNFSGQANGAVTGFVSSRSEPISLSTLEQDCFIIPVRSLDRFLPAGIPVIYVTYLGIIST